MFYIYLIKYLFYISEYKVMLIQLLICYDSFEMFLAYRLIMLNVDQKRLVTSGWNSHRL